MDFCPSLIIQLLQVPAHQQNHTWQYPKAEPITVTKENHAFTNHILFVLLTCIYTLTYENRCLAGVNWVCPL